MTRPNQRNVQREEARIAAAVKIAAGAMSRRRWAKVSPEERSRIAAWVSAQGGGRPRSDAKRCPCGNMTLRLAKVRAGAAGTSLGHEPECRFFRDYKLKVR
jgi:hypothetical protein